METIGALWCREAKVTSSIAAIKLRSTSISRKQHRGIEKAQHKTADVDSTK
jgi:hypothetical protein